MRKYRGVDPGGAGGSWLCGGSQCSDRISFLGGARGAPANASVRSGSSAGGAPDCDRPALGVGGQRGDHDNPHRDATMTSTCNRTSSSASGGNLSAIALDY